MATSTALAMGAASTSSLLSRHTHLISLQQQSHNLLWRSLPLPSRSLFATPSRRNRNLLLSPRAQAEESFSAANSSAAGASADSVVAQVAVLEEEPDTPGVSSNSRSNRRPSPLERGGTLSGNQAAGKDPGLAALGKSVAKLAFSGSFEDARWKNGTWDLQQFTRDGKVDWDAVIDAEVLRRKWLEENPEASKNDDPVVFETSTIPWWAWVKRFHLPEAELLNGRAAMIGFFLGYVVDSLTGAGLVDQTSNFFGKLLLLISVLGVLFVRKNEDVENLKQLVKEWNFYDKQWQATWQEEQQAPSPKREE